MNRSIKHWRRRQLMAATKELYENNFKDSANWSAQKMDTMLKFYSVVKDKIELEGGPPAVVQDNNQLDLFDAV